MKKNLLLVILLFVHFFATSQTTLVSYGSTWKYLDNGSNQGTAWIQSSFNDAAWATGAAPLGYGNANVITAVSFGSNANKKYLATYFRLKVTISDASAFGTYTLNVKRDDGAVIYINGVERYRTNMPTGSINANTKAAADATDNGNTAQTATLPAGSLVTGTNVIAVEVHQRATNSDDLFFRSATGRECSSSSLRRTFWTGFFRYYGNHRCRKLGTRYRRVNLFSRL